MINVYIYNILQSLDYVYIILFCRFIHCAHIIVLILSLIFIAFTEM